MKEERDLEKIEASGVTIIAIDGPSGGGKSSIAQSLAVRLGCSYLETGSMYRAAAYHVLQEHVAITNIAEIVELINHIPLKISLDPHDRRVFINDKDVSGQLRDQRVTTVVSAIAAVADVRKKLVSLQRKVVLKSDLVVAEGRDIGTVVFPEALVKIFLTASVEARAKRRANQEGVADVAAVQVEVARRDKLDSSRAASPLRPAHDAIIIDSSDLSEEETLDRIYSLVCTKIDQLSRE